MGVVKGFGGLLPGTSRMVVILHTTLFDQREVVEMILALNSGLGRLYAAFAKMKCLFQLPIYRHLALGCTNVDSIRIRILVVADYNRV